MRGTTQMKVFNLVPFQSSDLCKMCFLSGCVCPGVLQGASSVSHTALAGGGQAGSTVTN